MGEYALKGGNASGEFSDGSTTSSFFAVKNLTLPFASRRDAPFIFPFSGKESKTLYFTNFTSNP